MSAAKSRGGSGRKKFPLKRLRRRLREGATGDEAAIRAALSLSGDPDDRELARELVRAVSRRTLARVRASRDGDDGEETSPDVVPSADSSFLGRLSATADRSRAGDDAAGSVAELENIPTLLAVLRAGALAQRRAAATRLAARLDGGDLSNEEIRAVTTTLLNLRDVAIAFEVAHAREALAGAPGRQARTESEEFDELVEELTIHVDDFWSGQSEVEPVAALPPDERAQLMVRLRDAPDIVLHHLSSVLEASDGSASRPERLALLSSLRYSGDVRLVPSLLAVIDSRVGDLVTEAARVLGHIDDLRVHPALATAYERSVVDEERATLAGALGRQGDVRGRDYVRKLLATDDDRVRLAAVEAMESLATSEDLERLVPMLERPDPVLLSHVMRSLGRAADPRALLPLNEIRRDSGLGALWADSEDAELAIRASMELRGEEPAEDTVTFEIAHATASGIAERTRDPVVVRVSSWLDFVVGHLWLGLGGAKRAIRRFERAAGRRPGWAAPLAALAMHHARNERPGQALSAFRRALESDKTWVERNVFAIRTLVRIFLRRAEEVEKSGRVDIARGLVEEVLSLDLRRVPGELRFELTRRQQQMRGAG